MSTTTMSATSIEPSGTGPGTAYVTIPNGTAATQWTAANDAGFRANLAIIACLVATAVMAESSSLSSRANYAATVLADPVSVVNRSICYAVVADGVTGPSSTDNAIANRLGDIWNFLARAY